MIYKLPGKKIIMRSVVDALLLITFAIELERSLKNKRKILLTGTPEEKYKIISLLPRQ